MVIAEKSEKKGTDKYRVGRIDVVATILGKDELQWLDITIKRPTAATKRQRMVDSLPFRTRERENEQVWEQERDRPGHGEADQLRTGWKTMAADDNFAPRVDNGTSRSPWWRA